VVLEFKQVLISMEVNAPGGPPRLSNTEEYDGSSWTAGGGLNTARGDLGGAGTLTAGLAFGGNTNTPSFTVKNHYDGSHLGQL
jgi:hypothetical protein